MPCELAVVVVDVGKTVVHADDYKDNRKSEAREEKKKSRGREQAKKKRKEKLATWHVIIRKAN